MKRYGMRIVSLLLVAIMLCTGCTGPKAAKRLLPRYAELYPLIGLSLDEALEKMGWQEEDIEQWYDEYLTPMEGEIGGVPFTIRWRFEEKLNKIVYVAEFQDELEMTVKNTLNVANAIGSAIGKETVYDNLGIFDITEAKLQEILADSEFDSVAVYWDLNELTNSAQQKYMRKLREKGWREMPGCFLVLNLMRVDDTVYLWLEYGIMFDPTNPYNAQLLPKNDYHS